MKKLTKSIQKVNSNPKESYSFIEGKGFVFNLGGLVALLFPGVFEHILSLYSFYGG